MSITINDFFGNIDLFSEINKITTLDFLKQFNSDVISKLYFGKYGLFKVTSFCNTYGKENVINMLATNVGKWNKIYYLMTKDLDIDDILSGKTSETSTVKNDTPTKTTRTTTELVSAFNDIENTDDDFSNKSKTIEEYSTNNTDTTTTKNISKYDITSYKDLLNYLTYNYIYDIIYKDINDIISLNYYN